MNEVATSCPCDTVKEQSKQLEETKLNIAVVMERLNQIFDSMTEVKTDVKDIKQTKMPTMDDFKALESRVDALEKAPAKRWNGLIDGAIGALVGGLVAFALSGLIGG